MNTKTIFELMNLSDKQKEGMFVALADLTNDECQDLIMVACVLGSPEYCMLPLDEVTDELEYRILKVINNCMVDCFDVKLSKVKADK